MNDVDLLHEIDSIHTKKNYNVHDLIDMFAVGVVFVFYVWLTWMSVENPLDDLGRWMHEVDRIAHGELPYKDFTWQYPPLVIFIYGIITHLFGSNFLVIRISTIILTGFISILTWILYRNILPSKSVGIACIGTLLVSWGISSVYGPALIAGDYSPTMPIGIIFILILLFSIISLLNSKSQLWFIVAGLASSACLLTKHDFWIPVFSIGLFITFLYYFKDRLQINIQKYQILLFWLIAIIPTCIVYIIVAKVVGLSNLLDAMTGYGLARVTTYLPSIRTILDQIAMSSMYVVFFIIVYKAAGLKTDRKLLTRMNWTMFIAVIIGLLIFSIIILKSYLIIKATFFLDNTEFLTNTSIVGSAISPLASFSSIGVFKAAIMSTIANTIFIHFIPGVALMILSINVIIRFFISFEKQTIKYSSLDLIHVILAIVIFSLQARSGFHRTHFALYFVAPIFLYIYATNLAYKFHNKTHSIVRFGLYLSTAWFVIGISLFAIVKIRPIFDWSHSPPKINQLYKIVTAKGDISLYPSGATPNMGEAIQKVIDIVLMKTNPDESLLSLPYSDFLYMTDRRSLIKATQFIPSSYNISEQVVKNIIHSIEMEHPLILINDRRDPYPQESMGFSVANILSWEHRRYLVSWRDTYPDLWNYIEDNYHLVSQIYLESKPTFSIWEYNNLPIDLNEK